MSGSARPRARRVSPRSLPVDRPQTLVHNDETVVDFAVIESCIELTSEHAVEAASSLESIRAFLARMAEIARPDEGCPKVLMVVARLAGQDWLDGELRAELTGDEASTTLTLISEFGAGIRERLLPAVTFKDVPLDEFSRALALAPALAQPLRVKDGGGKIVLAPPQTPDEQMNSAPPPAFALDERSLGEDQRRTAPPVADAVALVEKEVVRRSPPPPNGFAAALGPPPETDIDTLDDAWDVAAPGLSELSDPGEEPPLELIEVKDEEAPLELIEVTDDAPVDARPSGVRAADGSPLDFSDGPPATRPPSVHTRPTVRRMVAVDAAALRRRDPRREDDD